MKFGSILFWRILLVIMVSFFVFSQSGCATFSKRSAAPKPTYQSDFYSTVNASWLAANPAPPAGHSYWSTLAAMADENDKRMLAVLESLTLENHAPGTKERKLADFYRSACDMESRNRLGPSPILPYPALYEKADTLQRLFDADMQVLRSTGFSALLCFSVFVSDGTGAIAHSGPQPIGLDVFSSAVGKERYTACLEKAFGLSGFSPADARRKAECAYGFERDLSAVALSTAELYNPDRTKSYSLDYLRALYRTIDFDGLYAKTGYPKVPCVFVPDIGLLEKAASWYSEDNLETLKAYAQARLLAYFGRDLSDAFVRVSDELYYSAMGGTSDVDNPGYSKHLAEIATRDSLSEYMQEIFAERCFSPESKKDVESLCAKIVAAYKTQISQTGLLDDRTRKRAIKKLDALRIKVGYPDSWPDIFGETGFSGSAEGGGFFANRCAANLARKRFWQERAGNPVDDSIWCTPVFTANAFYSPGKNEIVIPAGFLQMPMYDPALSVSEKMGGLGCAIAHEISHAFDRNGINYNEWGSFSFVWTAKSLERYQQWCARIVAFYDGIEIAPGIYSSGKNTLSENIADIAGMQCALSVLSREKDPDHKAFFESFAAVWKETATPEFLKYMSDRDGHSLGKVRVNRTVSDFQEFQSAFDIKPGDAMYVAPTDRVGLW